MRWRVIIWLKLLLVVSSQFGDTGLTMNGLFKTQYFQSISDNYIVNFILQVLYLPQLIQYIKALSTTIYRPLRYEWVYMYLGKVAYTPFHIYGYDIILLICFISRLNHCHYIS